MLQTVFCVKNITEPKSKDLNLQVYFCSHPPQPAELKKAKQRLYFRTFRQKLAVDQVHANLLLYNVVLQLHTAKRQNLPQVVKMP